MTILATEIKIPLIQEVSVTADTLRIELDDGRTLSVPAAWYPRLLHATDRERQGWQLIGGGQGIHWPALDEDISVENLISGKPSGESRQSLQKWLDARK